MLLRGAWTRPSAKLIWPTLRSTMAPLA